MSAAAAPKYRALPLGGSLSAHFDKRPDGSTLVTSTEPLGAYPVLYWPAGQVRSMSPATALKLRAYIAAGGLVLFDFGRPLGAGSGARDLLEPLGLPALSEVGSENVLSRSKLSISSREVARRTRAFAHARLSMGLLASRLTPTRGSASDLATFTPSTREVPRSLLLIRH